MNSEVWDGTGGGQQPDPALWEGPDVADQVAIVGMAGRFPGAADIEQFWANLCLGVESLTVAHGSSESDRYGALADGDCFDADFFGYTPNEALMLDPQHRVFLEVAHQALEDAGCHPGRYRGSVGLFAGGSVTRYAQILQANLTTLPFLDPWQIRLSTGADFLTTRTAHRLGLRGPVCTVLSACSTSLVAVHLAAQAVLNGECDVALAGGASVHVPPPSGMYVEGGILSPRGRCRAFDAEADGTVGGSAAGVVVLRPLVDALEAGDRIYATVLGSTVNNDGSEKIGFTAPSVEGQARVIRQALCASTVHARTVTYVEAHGTGTPLGDPIEVAALTKAFRHDTTDTGFCALGSVKTNIGHTDAAAGVVSLIKTALCLQRGYVPPTLNHDKPNPEIDFGSTPFVVTTKLQRWQVPAGTRRAGVSALGLGGTNAHVVLEEPPAQSPGTTQDADEDEPVQLITLSAPDLDGLERLSAALGHHLRRHPDLQPADLATSLERTRLEHAVRRAMVCRSREDALDLLEGKAPERVRTLTAVAGRPVALVFPGQGVQHPRMAARLLLQETTFREPFQEVAGLVADYLDGDLVEIVLAAGQDGQQTDGEKAGRALAAMTWGQPAVFAVEYALAQWWRARGVAVGAVLGHSLGAYAAACTAGIMSLPDAVHLVVERGRLLDSVEAGAMLGIDLTEHDVLAALPTGLDVAAVNGPTRTTVSGPARAVRQFQAVLTARGVATRRLRIATAGHSALVEPVLDRFEEVLRGLTLRPPLCPLVSDTTGDWASHEEVVTAQYWRQHLRGTIRFNDALHTLLSSGNWTVVECGPGTTLTALARQHPSCGPQHLLVHTLPHPSSGEDDLESALVAEGAVWAGGTPVERSRSGQRVALPPYPFARNRHLVEADVTVVARSDVPPLSASGTGNLPADPPALPSSPEGLVGLVVEAFRSVLGIPDVGPHDSFFDLGGDSLVAPRVATLLRSTAEVPFSARELFIFPTPQRIAEVLLRRRHDGEREIR
jgi:phthiocerol/phenolphthiocerol synthesis type-I polyketide synthase E